MNMHWTGSLELVRSSNRHSGMVFLHMAFESRHTVLLEVTLTRLGVREPVQHLNTHF